MSFHQFIGRPLGEANRPAIAMVFLSVRLSVTRVYFGETREPIEFIFDRYLPMENSNPNPNGDPFHPLSYGPRNLGLGHCPTLSNRDEILPKHATWQKKHACQTWA